MMQNNDSDRVQYQSISAATISSALSVCLLLAVLVICSAQPQVIVHLHPKIFPALVLALISAVAVTACSLWMASRRESAIIFDDRCLKFPPNLAPDLLFRLYRSWGDISCVGVEDLGNDNEFACHGAKLDKRILFFYFKSGGHVNLSCANFGQDNLESFIDAIVGNAPPKTCAPEIYELQRYLTSRPTSTSLKREKSGQSEYTQMWESELEAHMNATNFVPLEAGHKLGGKFVVRKSIACGGMSAVYIGDSDDGIKVVIKEACVAKRSDPAVRAKARELFEREALLLYKLEHPKIAKVMDYFVEEGRDYLVLEYVAGCSLRQFVQANGAQEEVNVIKLASQICDILTFLHEHDPPIVHRDITPDNIVIKKNQEICLIDFGAANEFVGTMTGTVVGKQCYIAPEQFRGKATPASDIYALGCTMYYLITGGDPEPLSTSHPKDDGAQISNRLDRLIQACTACDTGQRIGSAEKLKVELLADCGDVIDISKFRARKLLIDPAAKASRLQPKLDISETKLP